MSSRDGVGSPLGWLCTRISAVACNSSARLTTSRGYTGVWFTVPRCLRLVRQQPVAVVEEQHAELLHPLARQFGVEIGDQPVPVVQHGLVDDLRPQQPQRRRLHRLQRGDAGLAQPLDREQLLHRRGDHRGKAAEARDAASRAIGLVSRRGRANSTISSISWSASALGPGSEQALAQPPAVAFDAEGRRRIGLSGPEQVRRVGGAGAR